MKVRAAKDLGQLSDPDFFTSVSEGLNLIVANVERLWKASQALDEVGRRHAAGVMTLLAEEEAAKYLILIDAVRCPRQDREHFSRQLGRFNDHLAKGIYAKACWMRPATLGQLQGYINLHRPDFYLDGPNGVDWIFRNEVIQARESAIYVDYVANDDGHQWSDPGAFEAFETSRIEPQTVQQAGRLHSIGMGVPAALATAGDLWRDNVPVPDTQWDDIRTLNHRTLEILDKKNLLARQPQDTYTTITDEWQFPMHTLDLSPIRVELDDLRRQQRDWSPDW